MPATITITVDDHKLAELIAKTGGQGPVRIVADGVHYGIYQEMGFHHWRSGQFIQNPFMVPAVEQVRGGFVKAFRGCITLRQAEMVVDKAAHDIERGAKVFAPVDTGALRNSIHVVSGTTFGVSFQSMR